MKAHSIGHLIALTGIAISLSILQPASAAVATNHYAEIVEDINAFDLDGAQDQLDEYQGLYGEDAEYLYYRARIAILQGNPDAASDLANRCIDAWPDASLCHEALGEAALVRVVVGGNPFAQLGASRTGRKHLERAVALNPDNLRARMLLVRYYSLAPWFAGGSLSKARAQVAECRERDPFWGHEAAALLALAEGNYADAVRQFQAASKLRPEERVPSFYLARAYALSGDTSAGINVLETLIARYPRFHEAWLELGRLAAEQDVASPRGTAALEHFLAEAADAPPDQRINAMLTLASLHDAAERPQASADTYSAALAEYPDSRKLRRAWRAFCRTHAELGSCRSS